MKIKLNVKYLCAFAIVLTTEIAIALFLNDKFIRPYVGDVLVMPLIYCFIKSFVANKIPLLPWYLFIFAAFVEVGQYFNLAALLGLNDCKIARIVIGSTFDIRDIICYLTGCIGILLFESAIRAKSKR